MSRRLSSRRIQILIISGVFLLSLLVTAFFAGRKYNDSRPIPGSTYNPGSKGTKALYLTLEKLGYKIDRLQLPFDKMKPRQTLVINNPPGPLSKDDWQQLDRFAEQGGRVIFVAHQTVKLGGETLWRSLTPTKTAGISVPTRTGRLTFKTFARLEGSAKNIRTLIGDKSGALLLSTKRGRGELIALADPEFFSNTALKHDPDRIDLIIALLGPKEKSTRVLFDEWIHGFHEIDIEPGNLANLPVRVWKSFPLWLKLLIFQAALLLPAWLYSSGKRVGPPIPVSVTEDDHPPNYVEAMADMYRRAGAGRHTLTILYRRFLTDIAGRGLTMEKSETLAKKLVESNPGGGDEAAALLNRCTQIVSGKNEPEESELISLANSLAILRREIKKYG